MRTKNTTSVRTWMAVVCLAMWPTVMRSQVECTNHTLQDIVDKLPLADHTNGEFVMPTLSKERPIIMTRNPEGLVSHVGFKLFDRAIITRHPSPIYYFLERYLLQLLLLPDNHEVTRQLKSDRVKIDSELHDLTDYQKGLSHIVSDDTSGSSVYITCNNNRYTVSCMKGNSRLIRISLPVRHELITGYSKLEAESSFYPELLKFTVSKQEPLDEMLMDIWQDSLYCANQSSYGIQDILSTSYYSKTDNEFVPLFTPSAFKESVYNLFNAIHQQEIPVNVTQSLYGKKLSYTVTLDKLTAYLRAQQCQMYTGISEITESAVKAVVIAINTELGYQHLISFTCPTSLFSYTDGETIEAKMYCFTPIHNISSLYNEKNK